MGIMSVRHNWPENKGFFISRPTGCDCYTFLHFKNSILLKMGGRIVKTEPNACILYGVGEPQWFKSKTKLIHNWMHFTKDLSHTVNMLGIEENRIYYPKSSEFITEIFCKAEAESFSDSDFKEKLLDTYLTEFLILFSRTVNGKTDTINVGEKEKKRIISVRNAILACPEKHWSVEEMSHLAYLSPSRFHAVYKSVFGISPVKDIIISKISKAKNLLISGDANIEEISEILGYSSKTHFIRQFKQITGVTPCAYRKRRSL